MTHLPYVAATYALGVGVPLVLAVLAMTRLSAARRRLAAVDPRAGAGS
jgi:cytochrome c biogenesis protein CcdA